MDARQKAILDIAAQLMNGLIVKGIVKPGDDPDNWNNWCIRKASRMYINATTILYK